MMRVLGIDPGYDRCGMAVVHRDTTTGKDVVEWSDCVVTDKTKPYHERLAQVCTAFERILDTYTPTHLTIETLFFNKNVSTALKVAEVRGALLYETLKRNITILELSPQDVKSAVTGFGNADKAAIARMIPMIAILPECTRKRLDDEFDAISVAIAGLSHARIHSGGLATNF